MFQLKKNNTTFFTEVMAGVTTFITMSYIIFVNPSVLTQAPGAGHLGVNIAAATCVASALGTLIMAFYANIPFALAPGMGLNAFFTFTVAQTFGGYRGALAVVFISGLLFILITLTGIREAIVMSIPESIKNAITAGLGLFISFIGMQNAGLIVDNPNTLVGLADFSKLNEKMFNTQTGLHQYTEQAIVAHGAVVALVGVMIIGVLMKFKVKGAILFGMAASTLLAWRFGMITIPEHVVTWQGFNWHETLLQMNFKTLLGGAKLNLHTFFSAASIVVSCFLVDLFDTIGTLLGTAERANIADDGGKFPQLKKALMADALATTIGACLGTSTVTTYMESNAGISEGGRTGLASLVTGILFLLAIFVSPLALIVPSAATAPALIMVGILMSSAIAKINFDDITEALPAFLVIILMPLTYSVSTGIGAGLITYPLIKLLSGKFKEVHVIMWLLAILFILKFTILPH